MPRRTRRSTAKARAKRNAVPIAPELTDNTPALYENLDANPSIGTTDPIPGIDSLPDLLAPVQSNPIITTPGSADTPVSTHEYVDNNYELTALDSPKKTTKAKPKKVPTKRPAFVMKLWNMVNDPSNSKYISWLPDGKAFQVNDRESFMKHVLPKYFKHNNFASFVRQLNMYGWHKVQDVSSGSMMGGDEVWQFENPNFQRGRDDLLDNIVRNRPAKETEDEDVDINSLMQELDDMRKSQKLISDDLRRVKEDNEMLWKENYMVRERHKAQSNTLDKILRFLASIYGNNSTKFLENVSSSDLNDGGLGDFDQQTSPLSGAGQNLYDYNYDGNAGRRQLMISNKAYTNESPMGSIATEGGAGPPPPAAAAANMGTSDSNDGPIEEIHRGPENRNSDPFFSHFPSISSVTPGSTPGGGGQYLPDLNRTNSLFGPDGKSSSISSNPEEVMGNIHSRVDQNENQLQHLNEWVNRLSTSKPSEAMHDDELAELLLPQDVEQNGDIPALYRIPSVPAATSVDNPKKRAAEVTSAPSKKLKR